VADDVKTVPPPPFKTWVEYFQALEREEAAAWDEATPQAMRHRQPIDYCPLCESKPFNTTDAVDLLNDRVRITRLCSSCSRFVDSISETPYSRLDLLQDLVKRGEVGEEQFKKIKEAVALRKAQAGDVASVLERVVNMLDALESRLQRR